MGNEVIEVVLDHGRRRCEIALRELVDVHVIFTSEKIVELLVVFGPVESEVHTTVEGKPLVHDTLHICIYGHIVLVDATLLDHILRA